MSENEGISFESEVEGIAELIERMGGRSLEMIDRDQIFEIHVDDTILTMAIIDSKKGIVAVKSNHDSIPRPEVRKLTGSIIGGSALKKDWLGIGMRLELVRPMGVLTRLYGLYGRVMRRLYKMFADPVSRTMLREILTTGDITTIRLREGREEVRKLIKEAKRNS